jgi:hypothetical protein
VMDPDNPTRKDTHRRVMIGMVLKSWLVTSKLLIWDLLLYIYYFGFIQLQKSVWNRSCN